MPSALSPNPPENGHLPLSELVLDADQMQQAAQAIRRQGFFELAMHQVSVDFLREVPNASQACGADTYPLLDTTQDHSLATFDAQLGGNFEARLTQVAQSLVQTLCRLDQSPALSVQELCVRQPDANAAARWHVDRAPKVLTIFGTVRGKPTRYLLPPFDRQAVDLETTPAQLVNPEVADQHMQTCKPHHFYWVGAKGLHKLGEGAEVPLLVHSAPGEPGRQLFLARWLPERHARPSCLSESDRQRLGTVYPLL